MWATLLRCPSCPQLYRRAGRSCLRATLPSASCRQAPDVGAEHCKTQTTRRCRCAPRGRLGGSFAEGIIDLGQIVGYFQDSSPWQHGFLYTGGSYTTLSNPSANPPWTFTTGINIAGQIVGSNGGLNGQEGFLYSGGNYTALKDPNAVVWTSANGIN